MESNSITPAGFTGTIFISTTGGARLIVGFSISGLSAIGRSGPTQWHDGKRGGVSLKENSTTNESSDRFTLDGQRLVITSGTWGAPGSTYGTEIDTFSRITALGDTNAGPLSWKVETKAGLACEYGATADSRARANRASISGDDALLSLC